MQPRTRVPDMSYEASYRSPQPATLNLRASSGSLPRGFAQAAQQVAYCLHAQAEGQIMRLHSSRVPRGSV